MKKDNQHTLPSHKGQLDYERASFPEVGFSSMTKRLSKLSTEHKVVCPRCGNPIDFNSVLEWYGPSHFTCVHCQKLVHIRRIHVKA